MYTPLAHLTTASGRPSGPVHGFLKSLIKISRDNHGKCKFVICWDKSSSQFRTKIFPEYKAHRYSNITDEDRKRLERYNSARFMIINILGLLKIPSIQIHGVEADDIIAFLVDIDYPGERKCIVSEDRDFLQLLKTDVDMYRPIKKEYLTFQKFISDCGLLPNHFPKQLIMMKAMEGDSSDGIPGIKGIGWKNSLKISEKLLRNEQLDPNRAKERAFMANIDLFHRNVQLVDLRWGLENSNIKAKIIEALKGATALQAAKYSFLEITEALKELELKQCLQELHHLEDKGLVEVLPTQ